MIEEMTQAEIAQYTPKERLEYEDSLKVYRDLKNVIDTAELRGLEKGREEGRIEVAKTMLENNMDIATISKLTGLSAEEIETL